jgi:hypothetical protein
LLLDKSNYVSIKVASLSMLFEKSYSLLIFKPVLLQICAVNSICLWTCHSLFIFACVSKRVQKYNSFLIWQAFLKKFFDYFFSTTYPIFLRTCTPPILSFRVGKDTTFTFYYPNLFSTFFKVFLTRLILSLCMNFCSNAGAKVEIFFVPTSLLYSFFNVFFDVFLNSLITRI